MVRVLGRQSVRPDAASGRARRRRSRSGTRRRRRSRSRQAAAVRRTPRRSASSPPRSRDRSTATRRRSRRSSAAGSRAVAGRGRGRSRCAARSRRRRRAGTPVGTLFAFRAPLTLAPGQAVTLRYAYGMAHGDQIAGAGREVPRAGRRRSRPASGAWRDWLPKADFGRRRRVGGARAAVGRVPAALGVGLRGGLRPPHDHAGRLLPVLDRAEPRLPELAALPAADGLRRSRAGARDPPLLDRRCSPSGRPAAVRHRPAVHAASSSGRRTTSTSGCCWRPPSTASARATPRSSTSSCRSTTRARRRASGST